MDRNNHREKEIRAVIFDWAGTVIDHGSWAPVAVFIDVFHRHGIEVGLEQIRAPMGMAKRDHIRAILELDEVRRTWGEKYGAPWNERDLDALYADFRVYQERAILERAQLIDGVPSLVRELQRRRIRIGSTTGYPRGIMEKVAPLARAQGFSPEMVCTGDDVLAGRPAPWMNFRVAERLGIYPMDRIVVVDDTITGVHAGIAAGAWTVGVSSTGNLVGLTEREFRTLPEEERRLRSALAADVLFEAGAHAVVESVADLPTCIDRFNDALKHGRGTFSEEAERRAGVAS